MCLAWFQSQPAGAMDAYASPEYGWGFLQVANSLTVSEYCEKFATTYCVNYALDYQEHSARVSKRSDAMRWLSNRFQPRDSRFTSGYTCRFQAKEKEGQIHKISVGLFLTGTLDFAEYTQWENLQIIPIEYVVDEIHGRAGYGVFKYLENR